MSNLFSDVVALAKAGWTPAQVKELMTMEATKKEEPEQNVEKVEKEEVKTEEPDYKALYEKSQKDLQKAQSANTREDVVPADESIDNIIADIVKNF